MKEQVIPCHGKKARPLIDWNWMHFEVEVESVDVVGAVIRKYRYH